MKLYKEIEETAYEIWEKSGRVHGRDLEHWVEAERIVKERSVMEPGEKKRVQEEKKTGKSDEKGVRPKKRKNSEES